MIHTTLHILTTSTLRILPNQSTTQSLPYLISLTNALPLHLTQAFNFLCLSQNHSPSLSHFTYHPDQNTLHLPLQNAHSISSSLDHYLLSLPLFPSLSVLRVMSFAHLPPSKTFLSLLIFVHHKSHLPSFSTLHLRLNLLPLSLIDLPTICTSFL